MINSRKSRFSDGLGVNCKDFNFKVVRLSPLNVNLAVDFFKAQPDEAFEFFRPHAFDRKSLLRLCRNKGFLAYLDPSSG